MNNLVLNNAIYFGKKILSFDENYNPIYGDKISFAYDTHTATYSIFTEEESEQITKIIENKDLKPEIPYLKEDLYSQLGQKFVDEMLECQVLLDTSRETEIGQSEKVSVWLQTSHGCNLSCVGCSTGMDVKQEHGKKMDLDTFEKSMRKICKDCLEKGVKEIDVKLGGGEPTLLGKKWIEDVAIICEKLAKEYNQEIEVIILSNGILLNSQYFEVLKKHKIACVVSAEPSRTFPKVNIPTVNLVLNNIQNLVNEGITVASQLTISAENKDDVVKVYKKITDMGVNVTWALFRPHSEEQFTDRCQSEKIISGMKEIYAYSFEKLMKGEFAGNLEEFDYFGVNVVKDRVCGAGKNYIILDYNADIYSCHENIIPNGEKVNILETDKNVLDIVSEIYEVPYELRFTMDVESDFLFKWQSGLGCPWVIKSEKGTYNAQSDYMINVYKDLAPILVSLNFQDLTKE